MPTPSSRQLAQYAATHAALASEVGVAPQDVFKRDVADPIHAYLDRQCIADIERAADLIHRAGMSLPMERSAYVYGADDASRIRLQGILDSAWHIVRRTTELMQAAGLDPVQSPKGRGMWRASEGGR